MRNKILCLLLVAFVSFSCEDKLDIQDPQSKPLEDVIKSETGLKELIRGNYNEAGQAAGFGGDLQVSSDLLGNTNQVSWEGTFSQPREFVNKQMFADNTFVRDIWLNFYEVINQSNLVIDNISVFKSDDDKKLYEAHAKFLRGLSYFELARNFGLQYEFGTANSQLAAPLILKGVADFTGTLDVARSSVDDLYNQAITDLTFAYNNLPANGGDLAGKYAARGIMARVYLQMSDFGNALTAANDVIVNSTHTLATRFDQAFNRDSNDSQGESIFDFQVTSQDGSNRFITFYASQANGGRGGDITVNSDYLNNFDNASNDFRASFFDTSTGSRLTRKYTNQFGNIGVVRIAEMYLIRAEANLQEGSSVGDSPLNDVNAVRRRSNTNLADQFALDLGSVDLSIIYAERQREFAFEGFLLHDLRRTKRNIGSLSYNDNSLVMPIPQREIDANTLLVQNPGY